MTATMHRQRVDGAPAEARRALAPLCWRLVPILIGLSLAPGAAAAGPPDPVRDAVERALQRLDKGSANYMTHRQCFSCHHQGMAVLAMTAARRRGFAVDADHIESQVAFTLEWFRTQKDNFVKGVDIGGDTATATYGLYTLDAAGRPADETTALVVNYLLQKQSTDGSWPVQAVRPPMEGSLFTSTGVALHVLPAYGPPEGSKDGDDLRQRIARACAMGLEWLRKNEPKTTEDKVFHLRGLVYGGAAKAEVEAARAALLKDQREDGSWSQLPEMSGDAYATGTALTALRLAGLAADAEAYQKGVKYLLAMQRPDGAWVVQTRSKPVQKFFNNGDPGDKSQFLSFATTGWATLALLETLPTK